MFQIHGTIKGEEKKITYRNGNINGDEILIKKAQEENKKAHGYLGLFPEAVDKDYLAHEIPAFYLLHNHVFETVTAYSTDWEENKVNAVY